MQKKILIIEDEINVASVLEDGLSIMDYDISIAVSGREGLKRASEIKPDLITLDIKMPDVDGIQVLKTLKADESTKGIPVIVISGLNHDIKKDCYELGAVDFFQKPLNFTTLRNRINSILLEKVEEDQQD